MVFLPSAGLITKIGQGEGKLKVEALGSLLKILIMLAIGVFCRKTDLLSETGTNELKKLVTSIVLPIAIFNALAIAEYDTNMVLLFLIILALLLLAFGVGFLAAPILQEPYRRYLPFVTSVYEGGMIAFPLYISLFGEEKLSNIAIFDIATMLFCFSVFISALQAVESGKKINVSTMVDCALHNPVFIAAVLGIFCGLTGVIKLLTASNAGVIYTSIKDIITAMLNPLILLIVGYNFEFDAKRLVVAAKAILVRVVTQGILFIPIFLFISRLYPHNTFMLGAAFIYMSAPPSLSIQSYIATEEPNKFIATVNSLYMIVTLVVYAIVAVLLT